MQGRPRRGLHASRGRQVPVALCERDLKQTLAAFPNDRRDLQLPGFQAVQRFVSLALILHGLDQGGLGWFEVSRGQAMAGEN